MSDSLDSTSELTPRDLFAVFAMQAMLSGNGGSFHNRWELAADAYRMADAMLEMRNKDESMKENQL